MKNWYRVCNRRDDAVWVDVRPCASFVHLVDFLLPPSIHSWRTAVMFTSQACRPRVGDASFCLIFGTPGFPPFLTLWAAQAIPSHHTQEKADVSTADILQKLGISRRNGLDKCPFNESVLQCVRLWKKSLTNEKFGNRWLNHSPSKSDYTVRLHIHYTSVWAALQLFT